MVKYLIIKKRTPRGENKFITLINYKNKWLNLLYKDKFMVSQSTMFNHDTLMDAYRTIALHRSGKPSKGVDRDKCSYINKPLLYFPIFGLIYFLYHLRINKVPYENMVDRDSMIIFTVVHSFSFVLLLILQLLL